MDDFITLHPHSNCLDWSGLVSSAITVRNLNRMESTHQLESTHEPFCRQSAITYSPAAFLIDATQLFTHIFRKYPSRCNPEKKKDTPHTICHQVNYHTIFLLLLPTTTTTTTTVVQQCSLSGRNLQVSHRRTPKRFARSSKLWKISPSESVFCSCYSPAARPLAVDDSVRVHKF